MADMFNMGNVQVAPVDQNFMIPNPEIGPAPTQTPPQLQHLTDVIGQYIQSKQEQQNSGGITQQILANRFQPTMPDIQRSIFESNQTGQYAPPEQVMAQRYQAELSPYTSMLSNQMKAGTQYMNMSGGGTGVLINRLMQENPGMTMQDALYAVQSGMKQNLQMNPQGQISPMQGAPAAVGQMQFGKQSGEQAANLQYAAPIASAKTGAEEAQKQQFAGPIAQQTEMGKNRAENIQQMIPTGDIVGLYGKLQQDAQSAPSGMLASGMARGANLLGMPTQGSIAQAKFDADLNNLYLATIRSLKGTGRVMEQELVKIGEAAPKATDSMDVKIAKAQAHMAYYQNRMKELGFDPNTGRPDNQGGIPNPPTPDQINSQMQQQGGATHRYNPATGQLEQIQ